MRGWSVVILATLIVALAAGRAIAAATATTPAAAPAEPDRTLTTIDFEERRLGNIEELPMHWAKVEGPGYPHYVNGRLTSDRARSGTYAFRLDLNGGSVAYRYDAGRVRVQPRSHYRVEVAVQASGLVHARARLMAAFADADGRLIAASVRTAALPSPMATPQAPPTASPDVAPAGQWQKLSVELSAEQHESAASLVVELAVLQPAQFSPGTLGDRALHPQDIRGSAWFDDVVIRQVPRVRMATGRPGNVFLRGERPSVTVTVNDQSTEDLAAHLVVTDAAGRTVYQRSGALDMGAAEVLGPGARRTTLLLPEDLGPGWYEAGLVMSSRGRYVGRSALALVILADDGGPVRPDGRFGLIATDLPPAGWAELPDVLPLLGAGRVKLAVWSPEGDVQQDDPKAFDRLLARLRETGITPTACFTGLPPNVARRLDGDAGAEWTRLLTAPREAWQPQLAFLVSRHALHLDRWQLGADHDDAFAADPRMRAVYQLVHDEVARLVQRPDLAMPWPAWHELDASRLPATVALSIPSSVLPHQVPLYMQDVRRHEGHALALSIQLLDREKYGRELQVRDLAQRVAYALSAGAQRIDLPLPLDVEVEADGTVVRRPRELLMVVRTLLTTLAGAQYRGRVPLAEDVEAFLFDRGGQGMLMLWARGERGGGARRLALNLGQRPRAIDLWGNVTPLVRTAADREAQDVELAVGSTPMFLVDIDGPLALLRASVAFDRPLIESSFQAHTRKVRFANPYRQAIAGTLKLKPPPGWTISPPAFAFSMNPGETFEGSFRVEFPYNSFAGAKPVAAQFDFQAERPVTLTVPLALQLGLSDVGVQTLAMRDGGDLLVQQVITNYGERKIDYSAFVVVPGHARQERLVTNLAPGRSAIKLYRVPAARVPPGTRVRSGVRETNGTRVLNDEVEVQ